MDNDNEKEATPSEALKAIQARLNTLKSNLQNLEMRLWSQEGLPDPNTIASLRANTNNFIQALQQSIITNSDVLATLTPYPLGNFPAQSHYGIVDSLTRKKLEPPAEDWIEERLKIAARFCEGTEEYGVDVHTIRQKDRDEEKEDIDGIHRIRGELTEEDIAEIWEEAEKWKDDVGVGAIREAMERYNAAQQDIDRTDGEDAKMEDAKEEELEPPRLPLATVLKFMSTGLIDAAPNVSSGPVVSGVVRK